jgi:hypothetical protein
MVAGLLTGARSRNQTHARHPKEMGKDQDGPERETTGITQAAGVAEGRQPPELHAAHVSALRSNEHAGDDGAMAQMSLSVQGGKH